MNYTNPQNNIDRFLLFKTNWIFNVRFFFFFFFFFNIKIWRRVKQLIERASFHMFPFNYFFLARPHRPGFPDFPLCWFAFYYFVSFHGSRCLIRPMHKERNQKNFLARNTNKSWATGEPQSTANKQKKTKTKRINVCVCVWAVLEFIVSFTIHGSRKSVCGASVIMDERGCVTEKFVTQIFVDCGLLFFRIRFERVKHEWTFLFPFFFYVFKSNRDLVAIVRFERKIKMLNAWKRFLFFIFAF